ncbi:MAG: Ig-like domain-containing protein, partial [Anaerolineales bacterium]|nr:Ig-like domain-containing protein [Anaerolineales bacterium]
KAGEVIDLTVTYSESVVVAGGTPSLSLNSGGSASYLSGSGTATLTFRHTVGASQNSADLDYSATSSLALNGATIRDAASNNVNNTLPAVGTFAAAHAIVIDTTAPAVTNVTSTTANGSYKAGVVIPVTVTFSEAVTVTGTPRLTLETGATDEVVNYSSGSGMATLTFAYTVQAGDTSADLDYKATDSLTLNGGTVKDAAGNNATLTLVAPGAAGSLGANKNIVIDNVAPTVNSAQTKTTTTIAVTFSEDLDGATVTVANFSVAGNTVTAASETSAGKVTLTLGTAIATDATPSVTYTQGTLADLAGNKVATTGPIAPSDGIAATVTSVNTAHSDGSFKAGEVIDLTVTYSESVVVAGGTPSLSLNSGGSASYLSGSGTATLTFR